MKNKKSLLTALVLSGSIGFACQSTDNQRAGLSTAERKQATSGSVQQKNAGRISRDDMQKVEEALKAKGYDPGAIDGRADEKTQQALRDFQTKNNLAVTGSIDPMTAESLGIVIVFIPE